MLLLKRMCVQSIMLLGGSALMLWICMDKITDGSLHDSIRWGDFFSLESPCDDSLAAVILHSTIAVTA